MILYRWIALPAMALLFSLAPSAHALTLPLLDAFESGLGNWTAAGNAGHYSFTGVGTNFASSGTGAARLTDGTITLTNPLALDAENYTSVTVNFDYRFFQASATRSMQLQYAADGLTFVTLGASFMGITGEGANPSVLTGSRTITEGPFAFTDLAKFRFNFFDSGSAPIVYVDNVRIAGFPVVSAAILPEPATATLALLGLSGLMRRRRRLGT